MIYCVLNNNKFKLLYFVQFLILAGSCMGVFVLFGIINVLFQCTFMSPDSPVSHVKPICGPKCMIFKWPAKSLDLIFC